MSHADSNRKWRHAHPENVKVSNQAYRAKHKEELNRKHREYWAAHREELLRKHREYAAVHRERIRSQRKAHREANHEELRLVERARWRKEYTAHPERLRIQAQLGGAKRRSAPGRLKRSEWEAIKAAFRWRCAYCNKKPKRLTLDHVLPLAKDGRNEASNVVFNALHPEKEATP